MARTSNRKHEGFSLVEIMVALTIGLIASLVVSQVMQVAEARRRATTSGADATVNATLGLFDIERDGRSAGYGVTSVQSSIGCEVKKKYGGEPEETFNLVPAAIVDGAAGAPDTLRFIASRNEGVAMPVRIAVDHPKTAANFFVESDLGINEGDLMIAVPSTIIPGTNWCTVFQVTGTGAGGGGGGNGGGGGGGNGGGQGQNQVLHNSGQSEWNQPGGEVIFPDAGYSAGDYVLNLGSFLDHTYSIADNHLRLIDYNMADNTSTNLDLYPHVVQLQAVYGRDTTVPDKDNVVDVWDTTAPSSLDAWQRVLAIRVALVARSQTPEPTDVTLDGTNAASTCNSASPHPAAVCWRPDPNGNGVAINVSSGTPNWKRFRYRVMETTIPLRNAIWRQ